MWEIVWSAARGGTFRNQRKKNDEKGEENIDVAQEKLEIGGTSANIACGWRRERGLTDSSALRGGRAEKRS